jgi:hypothetical protein
MSGYEKYYHAMQNRLGEVYTIPVNTEEGLQTLKNWLYDHLEGSQTGGLANFIACSPWNYTTLPEGTPQAGKKVIVGFCPEALHGMTVVGWNDSICFDYNGDTRYTNDEDITGDGVVDMQDWEIGGLRFANSYGNLWADSGYCYMMYRTLAAPQDEGGIWNNAVHVLMTKASYQPLLTMKVKLKHNARNMIRVRAGVSRSADISYPTHYYDYPVFQFQGGKKPMQGCDSTETCKVIEFGLDVTPLLSHVESGQPANFFLQIMEQDHSDDGIGELIDFSIIDYSSGMQEFPYPDHNIPLVNSGETMLMIPASVSFNSPEIITASLPALQNGVPVQVQMEATGGLEPYKWKIRHNYDQQMIQEPFPDITTQQLYPNAQKDSIFTIPLGFSFPFYGNSYDTLRVNAWGYVFFDENIKHWPYMVQEAYFFKHIQAISPFKSKYLDLFPEHDDGLWYEANEDYALFRWKTSMRDQDGTSELDFALKLEPDGTIKLYYGNMEYDGNIDWAGGISDGNAIDYHVVDIPNPRALETGTAVEYFYHKPPAQVSISQEGLLEIMADDLSKIYNLQVNVSDQNNIQAYRTYQLSDLLKTSYVFNVDGDTNIKQGADVLVDYTVKNTGLNVLENVEASIYGEDEYITIHDGNEGFGNLNPGQSKTIEGAFRFSTSPSAQDGHAIILENNIQTSAGLRETFIMSEVKAPGLAFVEVQVDDNANGRLDPDESANLIVRIANKGRASALGVTAELVPLNEFVNVVGTSTISYGTMPAGSTADKSYGVHASPETLNGFEARFLVKITEASGIEVHDTLSIMVGKKPVLIIDLDPKHESGPGMLEALNELDIYADYTRTFPYAFNNYQSLFLSLGIQVSYYSLTMEEGSKLAAFLDDGGKIYLEGRRAWRDDPQTPVHSMFNIDINNIPVLYNVVQGIDSTFTEGMAFLNLSSPPFSYYSLVPVPPAYDILQNREDSLSCAVAHDAGHYKTIGSVIEFGKLLDDTSSKTDLMEQFLLFFDIRLTTIGIDEPVPGSNLGSVYNYPNPFRGQTNISFTLEKESKISLGIYNMNGQLIRNLLEEDLFPGGTHTVPISSDNLGLPSGVYLYRFVSERKVVTRKMILLD